MIITKDFKFEAGHHLRNYKGKCQFPHGHSYFGKIQVEGELDKVGFVLDYGEISKVVDYLDHTNLNDLKYFREVNPTAENIAQYILDEVMKKGEFKVIVELHETASSSVIVISENHNNSLL